jgi:hypothetical protein
MMRRFFGMFSSSQPTIKQEVEAVETEIEGMFFNVNWRGFGDAAR